MLGPLTRGRSPVALPLPAPAPVMHGPARLPSAVPPCSRPALPRPRRGSRGLTLLELMAAIAVMAVLGALAVPAVGERMQRQRAAFAAETLRADLDEARFEAVRTRRTVAATTRPGATGWCWGVDVALSFAVPPAAGRGQADATPGCGCDGSGPCATRRVLAAAHPGVAMPEGGSVALRADGTAVAGTVAVFATPRGDRLRVTLGPSGRGAVCTEGAALLRYPRC